MKNNQIELKELNLEDFNDNDSLVDYYDGDIAFIDNISHLTDVAPIYAKMNFIVLCTKGRIQFDINDQHLMLTKQQVLLSAPFVILDNYLFSPDFECKILCLSDDLIHAMLSNHVNVWNLSVHSHRTSVIELPADDQQQLVYYYELVKFKVSHQDRRNNTFILKTILQAMLMDASDAHRESDRHPRHNINIARQDDFRRVPQAALLEGGEAPAHKQLRLRAEHHAEISHNALHEVQWPTGIRLDSSIHQGGHTLQPALHPPVYQGDKYKTRFPEHLILWQLRAPSVRSIAIATEESEERGVAARARFILVS